MRLRLLLMLLLCSCATQRQAEKYFDAHTDELAKYVDENEAYTRKHGAAYAAKHFPPRFYAPAIHQAPPLRAERLKLYHAPGTATIHTRPSETATKFCPTCSDAQPVRTVYVQNTVVIDSLERELSTERLANTALRKRLKDTTTDRDYWREMNRKKRWALVAMAIFAALYILFKVLESRVRET